MWCKIPIKTTLILETEYSQKSKDRELFAEIIWRTILNNEYNGGNRSHFEYLMQVQKKNHEQFVNRKEVKRAEQIIYHSPATISDYYVRMMPLYGCKRCRNYL